MISRQFIVCYVLSACITISETKDEFGPDYNYLLPTKGNDSYIRERRDGYGGYGGGYGGGCSCPYYSCNDKNDGLTAFGFGALVGLLLALLRALGGGGPPASTGRSIDSLYWLPVDIPEPECTRQWVCEMSRRASQQGGLRARFGALSSLAYGWYTKDSFPIIQSLLLQDTSQEYCEKLGPSCDVSFLT